MQPLIQTKATLICRYPIASSDMYYSEVGQRDVYVRDDLVHGFQIWGQLTGTGEETAISLCEIFLEYAMLCQTAYEENQAYEKKEAGIFTSFWDGRNEIANKSHRRCLCIRRWLC